MMREFYPMLGKEIVRIQETKQGCAEFTSQNNINYKYRLNVTSQKILDCCNGNMSIEDIANILYNEFAIDNIQIVYRDIMSVLLECYKFGFIKWKDDMNPMKTLFVKEIGNGTEYRILTEPNACMIQTAGANFEKQYFSCMINYNQFQKDIRFQKDVFFRDEWMFTISDLTNINLVICLCKSVFTSYLEVKFIFENESFIKADRILTEYFLEWCIAEVNLLSPKCHADGLLIYCTDGQKMPYIFENEKNSMHKGCLQAEVNNKDVNIYCFNPKVQEIHS